MLIRPRSNPTKFQIAIRDTVIPDHLRHSYATICATYTNDGKLKPRGSGKQVPSIVHTKFGTNIFPTLAVAWFCHIFTPHLRHFTPTRAGPGMGAASHFNQRPKTHHDAKFHTSSMLYIMTTKMTKMLSFHHSRHLRHPRQNCGQMMKTLYKNDKIGPLYLPL